MPTLEDCMRRGEGPSRGPWTCAEDAVRYLLGSLGEDPDRDGLQDTPARFAKLLREMTAGSRTSEEEVRNLLGRQFDAENFADEMVCVSGIWFYSLCEHHLAPFFGTAAVAYIPRSGRIVGLSKLARLVDLHARRLQNQERMTTGIAADLQRHLVPIGIGVKIEARHLCMESRGVQKPGAITTTTRLEGALRSDPAARDEFLRAADRRT